LRLDSPRINGSESVSATMLEAMDLESESEGEMAWGSIRRQEDGRHPEHRMHIIRSRQ